MMLSNKIKNAGERQYAELLESQNIKYIHQPKPICLNITNDNGKSIKYRPDFYLPKSDTYIEIVGTRQAYHHNKTKINIVKSMNINFKILKPDGDIFNSRSKLLLRKSKISKIFKITQIRLFNDQPNKLKKLYPFLSNQSEQIRVVIDEYFELKERLNKEN